MKTFTEWAKEKGYINELSDYSVEMEKAATKSGGRAKKGLPGLKVKKGGVEERELRKRRPVV